MENSFFEFRRSGGRGARAASDSDAIEDSEAEGELSFSLLRTPARRPRPPRAPPAPPAVTVLDSDQFTDDEDDDDMDVSMTKSKGSSKFRPKTTVCSTSDEEDNLTKSTPDRRTKLKCVDVSMSSIHSPFVGYKGKRNTVVDSPESMDMSTDSPFVRRKKGKPAMVLDSDTDDMTPDDDIVVSAATRMSIMGIKPKDMASDESDFIESDEIKSTGSAASLSELPEVDLSRRADTKRSPLTDISARSNSSTHKYIQSESDNSFDNHQSSVGVEKENGIEKGCGTKDLKCDNRLSNKYENNSSTQIHFTRNKSPFGVKSEKSPDLRNTVDLTFADNNYNSSPQSHLDRNKRTFRVKSEKSPDSRNTVDLTFAGDDFTKQYSVGGTREKDPGHRNNGVEGTRGKMDCSEDLVVVEENYHVIALSSDDDEQMSSTVSKPKTLQQPSIKKYAVPESYPNSRLVYVAKHVRDNEMNKLQGLKEDLHKLRYLMEEMDVDSLPDGGTKLKQRLSRLEAEVRQQGDKVAAMIVEPAKPTAADIAKDGFGAGADGLSWDDLQAASKMVQPKMFGKQAMNTHLAERSLILDRLRDLHESLASRPAESKHAPQPRALRATLMPHQKHALAWLQWRETQNPRGGILADDMGLGKTLTMISLVVTSKERLEVEDERGSWTTKENSKLVKGGTLVVCPASLLQQWAAEVEKHCAPHHLTVCLHHGGQRTTQPYKLSSYDMVITTYNIVSRDNDKKGVLMKVRWSRVILDEAHIVRNHKSLTANAMIALEGATRWCLTGTPVQNKELDVFALIKFLRCTPFDDIQMWKKWIDNKSAGGQERLSTVMRCLLLRRTKQQMQESGALTCLPDKTTHQLTVKLAKDEMNVYQKVLLFSKTLFAQFLHQRAERQADMSNGFLTRTVKDDAYTKMHKKMVAMHGAKPVKSHEILVLLLRLRQLCCHAGLIAAMLDPEDTTRAEQESGGQELLLELSRLNIEEDDGGLKDEGENEGVGVGLPEEPTSVTEAMRSVLSLSNPVFDLKRMSSKIAAVIRCLDENVFSKPDEKAVVVSQWTSVLSIVERELKAAGVGTATLSGKVPVPARAGLVTAFNTPNSNVKVLLLSLCAGGVGLNLCGGNHLLLLDPHWNPQLEEQAQDRIYRVGQHKPVHIYKFMCVDTVEQSIKRLQEHKLELATNVLTGAKHTKSSKLTIEDLKMLFNMNENLDPNQQPAPPRVPLRRPNKH